jgi:RNA polymerase sigma-70 factor (ECF subfamily)
MEDGQAISRLKRGDIGGLDFLVTRYQIKAIRTAFLITHDNLMAEDVVQDVFVRVFQRIQCFDESRPFEPYLMRSVVNAALNGIEKTSNGAEVNLISEVESFEILLMDAASVEEQVEFTQCKHEIMVALLKLSPRQRAVIVQKYYLDLSEKEMAQILGAAPGTVKWLLNAARIRLRTLLGSVRSLK